MAPPVDPEEADTGPLRPRGLPGGHDLTGGPWPALLLIMALGLVLVVDQASLRLNADDLAWLRGQAPTVFDQYRHLPRLVFGLLYALFGPSAPAALATILAAHTLNAWLLYRLALHLVADRLAAGLALAILMINPLTLGTLTWISCFSYVLGTTLALLALLALCRGLKAAPGAHLARTGQRANRVAWLGLALGCYVAGLLCSHEIFFLPVLFVAIGWLLGSPRPAGRLAALGLVAALAVNNLVYGFGRYGVDATRLWSADFGLAYASSALASGPALILAYPLSFLVKGPAPLQILLAEPLRWLLTTACLAAGAWSWGRGRPWRLALALAAGFVALISPYILRLYLTPDNVNFHISYALSGRVFYLAFTFLALALGCVLAALLRRLAPWGRAAILALALAVYGHAVWLYQPQDVAGLSVVHGVDLAQPPRWNPFSVQHPAWLLLPLLAVALALAWRAARSHTAVAQAIGNRRRGQ